MWTMIHPVQLGKNTRMSFSKIKEVYPMPNLIEIQTSSYEWFCKEGLKEVLEDISPKFSFITGKREKLQDQRKFIWVIFPE